MSIQAAAAFIARAEADETFEAQLEAVKDDPQAVLERLHAEGFDVEPPEVRHALLERYDGRLTAEQLDEIAAGVDWSFVALSAGVGGGTAVLGISIGLGIVAACA